MPPPNKPTKAKSANLPLESSTTPSIPLVHKMRLKFKDYEPAHFKALDKA
jgi:hypothetical protein